MTELDTMTKRVLDAMMRNPDASIAELGDKVGLSATPTHKRVKALRDSGLASTAIVINRKLSKLNVAYMRVRVSHDWTNDFLAFVNSLDCVSEVYQTFDMAFTLKVNYRDNDGYRRILEVIQGSQGVVAVEGMPVMSVHKESVIVPIDAL